MQRNMASSPLELASLGIRTRTDLPRIYTAQIRSRALGWRAKGAYTCAAVRLSLVSILRIQLLVLGFCSSQ